MGVELANWLGMAGVWDVVDLGRMVLTEDVSSTTTIHIKFYFSKAAGWRAGPLNEAVRGLM